MQSVSDVWSMILTRLREELSETTIKTWFDETEVVALEGDTMILYCPNAFKRSNIQDRFLGNIEAGLKDIFSSDITVKLLDEDCTQYPRTSHQKEQWSCSSAGHDS